MDQEIRPASTMVIANFESNWPYRILLIKRSEKAAFLPGAHVFPGGRVDKRDEKFGLFLAKDHVNSLRIKSFFAQKTLPIVMAHLSAAIRETLEEVGLSVLHLSNHRFPCDADTLRHLILESSMQQEFQVPRLDNIWPISWWITPKGEARRYNTWFFLSIIAGVPETKSHSDEIKCADWLSPTEALELYASGDIFLAPPTRAILERMVITKSLGDFLSYVDCPLRPIAPYFIQEHHKKWLVLPGDPHHSDPLPSKLPPLTRYAFP